MSLFNSRKTSVFIFAVLAFISLLAFQNCSQIIHLTGSSNPVQASSLNDMIQETEKEIKVTKAVMRGASRREVNEIRRVATYQASDKKTMEIKLKSKRPRVKNKAQVASQSFTQKQAKQKNLGPKALAKKSSAHVGKRLAAQKNGKSFQKKKNLKVSKNDFKVSIKSKKASKTSKSKAGLNSKSSPSIAKKQVIKKKKAQGISKKKSNNPKPKIIAKKSS